jgi:hypothetical protein
MSSPTDARSRRESILVGDAGHLHNTSLPILRTTGRIVLKQHALTEHPLHITFLKQVWSLDFLFHRSIIGQSAAVLPALHQP